MVKYNLTVSADQLENIDSVAFKYNTEWCLDLKAPTGDDTREAITVHPSVFVDVPSSRGTCNLIVKLGGGKPGTLTMECPKPEGLMTPDNHVDVVVAICECRGVEVVAWHAEECAVRSKGGEQIADVRESDWVGFDEKLNEPVSIYGFKTGVRVSKK